MMPPGKRFNAPPGWPPTPAGWTPPLGWTGNPAWPAPPPNWEWWISDGPNVTESESATQALPITQVPIVATPAAKLNSGKSWYRARWVLPVVALILGLFIGIGMGAATSSGQKEIAAANNRAAAAEGEIAAAKSEAKTATDTLAAAQQGIADQRAALDAAAAAVAAREKKVGAVEKAALANTFAGDGTYLVGKDVRPGVYKAAAMTGCYWARLKSIDTSDIIDNQNADGPVVLQILATDKAVEVSGCSEFHKVG